MLRPVLAAALAVGALFIGTPAVLAQGPVPCAQENGFCQVPYPTRVIYGIPGRSAAREVAARGIPCSNDVFGDPAPGIVKRCAYIARDDSRYERPRYESSEYDRPNFDRPRGYGRHSDYARMADRGAWRTCAGENGFCSFQGRMRVRYGADGRFAEGSFRNGVACNNNTFGDSAPGIRKICQVLD